MIWANDWSDREREPRPPRRDWLLWLLVPGVWLALTLAWIYWHRDTLLMGLLAACGVAGWLIVNGRVGA